MTHMTWPARLREITGGEVWVLGWVWALINVMAMLGSYVLPHLLMRFRREYVLVFSAVWRGVMLLIAALSGSFVPVFFGVLFSSYLTYLEPFVIGATCLWCLTSALILTAMLWLAAGPGFRALGQLRDGPKTAAATRE